MYMLRILSQGDRERIHGTGMRVLAEVGVRILDGDIYRMVAEAGGIPDEKDKNALRFPDKMVKKYLALCPKRFTLRDRGGVTDVVESGGKPLYLTSNGITYSRGASKKAVDIGEKEFVEFVRVVDKLDNVGAIVGTSLADYPPQARDYAGFMLMAQYTDKHLRPCIYTPSGAETIIEMADVILDGKSLRDNMFFTLGYSVVSPLTWSRTALELFYKTRGHGIPLMINSEPMAGGTSPVTLAGSLAMADAEVISGIVVNQIIEPGRPCVYNAGFAHVMDMLTATVLTGSPENALLQAAGAEMAAYHGLPCASWALSEALSLDSQASYEKMMTLLAHTLANVNLIWGVGNIETSKTISPEAAVIDNEMIGNCLRFAAGIKVDDDRLAFDIIKETGFGGNFLETDHTMEHFREELRSSRLPNREHRIMWERKGSKTVDEKAADTVNGILSAKTDYYLTGAQMEKMEKIKNKKMSNI